jgi:hypothetical protein
MNPQKAVITLVLHALLISTVFSASSKQSVRLTSPSIITGQHGIDRWPAKTDPQRPPADNSKILHVTPSQMFAWPGVGVAAHLTKSSPRIASEQRWVALTGLVAGMKIETDGDIHVELVDATGNKPGIVGAEIPPGKIWCACRQLALGWTGQEYPFSFNGSKTFAITGRHVITVTGKAFYDVDHAPQNRSNQRGKPFKPGYSVWEVHPVMGMTR